MSKELIDAMVARKQIEAVSLAGDLIENGEDSLKTFAACREVMEVVGKRFEKGEFFLLELIMAGEMLKQISELIKPMLKEDAVIERAGGGFILTNGCIIDHAKPENVRAMIEAGKEFGVYR